MELYITIGLIILLTILSYIIISLNDKISMLRKSNVSMEYKIREITRNYDNKVTENIDLEHKIVDLKLINFNLDVYLNSFINEKLKVFINSNFHSNYSVYNGKFYAKVSKSPTSTKGEAIPVLPIQGNKYNVIDIYKLKRLQKLDLEGSILSHLEACKTVKENMVKELGNKILTSYPR